MTIRNIGVAGFIAITVTTGLPAQTDPANFNTTQRNLVREHVRGGLPTDDPVLVRQGYIGLYNAEYRVPTWVAYHVIQSYRNTPPRRNRFATFRRDPDKQSSRYCGLYGVV